MKRSSSIYGADIVRQIEDLADLIPDHLKYERALAYALSELKKSGNLLPVNVIKAFMKCKRFSAVPKRISRLIVLPR